MNNHRHRVTPAIILMVVLTLLVGCTGTRKGGRTGAEEAPQPQTKIRAEAYLFDAKLRRQGKVNSFRLDLYQTDSVIAMSGRGYLGKHVVSGRLTADSLTAYFPTTGEYIADSIGGLLQPFDCMTEPLSLNIVPYFAGLPDSVPNPADDVRVVGNYENPDRPAFIVFMDSCAWQLELIYDLRDTGWRVREFSFTDGDDNSVTAVRRDYRGDAKIKAERFHPVIPADAVRIIP